MKKILIVFLLAFIANHAKSQTSHRITMGMNLQNKIDSAASGDVFYVEAGTLITNLDITKKVTIFGTGYFLSSGTTQATPGVSTFLHIRLQPGSDGSFISGLQCKSINIAANNIIIQRCYIDEEEGRIRLGYTGIGNSGGDWTGSANNCMLLQNYAPRLEAITQNTITSTASIANVVVKGNIFYRSGFHLEGNISGEISNNTFAPGITTLEQYHSFSVKGGGICQTLPITFKNNIMPNIYSYTSGICSIDNYPTTDFHGNVFTQNFTNLPTTNVINADASTLFLGYPNNTANVNPDARAQLASNSPAKGAGVGGTDAGAFGGDMPYVLSGIPIIPNIIEIKNPLQVSKGGTLSVQIKAKTNN
jgi:hypothetical protein